MILELPSIECQLNYNHVDDVGYSDVGDYKIGAVLGYWWRNQYVSVYFNAKT